jgi:hypothetical protein
MTILLVDWGGALRIDFFESLGRMIAGLMDLLYARSFSGPDDMPSLA